MLEILPLLVDRCIALIKRREEVGRGTHTDFVAPLVDTFGRVHADYLASFRSYHELVAQPHVVFDKRHPVFEALKVDRLYSQHLRSNVATLANALRPPSSARTGFIIRAGASGEPDIDQIAPANDLERLIIGIVGYLRLASISPLEAVDAERYLTAARIDRLGTSNEARVRTFFSLQDIVSDLSGDDVKRERAIRALDDVVIRQQRLYAAVLVVAADVRRSLVSPT